MRCPCGSQVHACTFHSVIPFLLWVQVEYMKSVGYMDKTHNRRRDNFTQYVEAAARSKALMGKTT